MVQKMNSKIYPLLYTNNYYDVADFQVYGIARNTKN